MKEERIRKTLVSIIIVLLIGAIVIPGITANDFVEDTFFREPSCNGQVEIMVELWKPYDVQIYPIYLTEEEYSQLIILTENFKTNLNSAVSYDEIVAIYVNMLISLYELGLFSGLIGPILDSYMSEGENYKSEYKNYEYESVVSGEPSESTITQEQNINMINQAILLLDELGLSPIGMTNEQNQNLLAENNLNADDLLNLKPYDGNSIDVCENLLCLTSGNPNNIHFYSGNQVFLEALYKFYNKLIEWAQNQDFFEYLNLDVETLMEIPDAINYLLGLFSLQIELPVGHLIGFGTDDRNSANGWVHTFGLNGIQAMEGDFYGQISLPEDIGSDVNYLGSIGFTGIRINPIGFYLGAALWVKIGLNPPGSSQNQDTPVVQDSTTSIPDNQVSESDQIQQENPEQNIPEDIPTPDESIDQTNNKPDKPPKSPHDSTNSGKKGGKK
jgi:hypothetical protein